MKTIIITGASEGIGASIADLFYKNSYNLVLIARRKEVLEQFASKFDKNRCLTFSLDVLNYSGFDEMLEKVFHQWGRIDVFVNNAGFHERGKFELISESGISNMVRVNLEAPLILTSKVLKYLKNQNFGHIIQIASVAGRTPVVDSAAYSATKFGLRAFSHAFFDELKRDYPNIHTSVISPGLVMTDFVMKDIENVADLTLSQPIFSLESVAEMVFDSIDDKSAEKVSGGIKTKILTNFSYTMPGFAKLIYPILKAKGRRVKVKLIKKYRREV